MFLVDTFVAHVEMRLKARQQRKKGVNRLVKCFFDPKISLYFSIRKTSIRPNALSTGCYLLLFFLSLLFTTPSFQLHQTRNLLIIISSTFLFCEKKLINIVQLFEELISHRTSLYRIDTTVFHFSSRDHN